MIDKVYALMQANPFLSLILMTIIILVVIILAVIYFRDEIALIVKKRYAYSSIDEVKAAVTQAQKEVSKPEVSAYQRTDLPSRVAMILQSPKK